MTGSRLTREQWLAILLGIVALVYWAGAPLLQTVLSPLSARQRTLESLRQKTDRQEQDLALIDRAQRQLQAAHLQALPPDQSTATALYQEWLIQTASELGLKDAVVTPHATVEEPEIGHEVSMTLQAQAGLTEISRLLQRIHSVPLLQRVESCSISQVDPQRPTENLKLVLQVAALSLAGGEPRTELMHPQARPQVPVEELPESLLASSKMFERTLTEVAEPSRAAAEVIPAVRNPLETIKLVGTWRTAARNEAWFLDEGRQQELVLKAGASFAVATLQGTVVSLGQDSVTVQVRGRNHTLSLGDPLSKIPN